MQPKVRRIDFSPDEWLAGTVELTLQEEGLYWRICSLIYSRGGPITWELLKRACRNDHGNRVRADLNTLVALGKVTFSPQVNGGEIDQKRCAFELENARIRVGKARENGAKGGRPNGLAKPDGYSPSKANHQPSTINHQREEGATLRAEFAAWYAAYPLHVGKGDAERAYTKARKKAEATDLLTGIERYRSGKPDYADWSHPATWLNKGRWLDEYPQTNGHALGYTEPWRQRLAALQKGSRWMADLWGPPPGEDGCRVPPELLC